MSIEQGNVPSTWINDQIEALNLSFAGFYGGVDTGFRFELAGRRSHDERPLVQHDPGRRGRVQGERALRRGGADALNIYTVDGGKYLGWAYFPSGYKSRPHVDGVIIASARCRAARFRASGLQPRLHRHARGRSLARPVPHVPGRCNAKGDYVSDTPAEKGPAFGCQVGRDTCLEAGVDPIHNYMDYSDDPCYFEFTAGQAERMQAQYLFFRA